MERRLPWSPRWLLIYQTKFVALGVGHHAPAESVLPEVLHRKPLTAQRLNLGRRLLNVVDPDVKMKAVLEKSAAQGRVGRRRVGGPGLPSPDRRSGPVRQGYCRSPDRRLHPRSGQGASGHDSQSGSIRAVRLVPSSFPSYTGQSRVTDSAGFLQPSRSPPSRRESPCSSSPALGVVDGGPHACVSGVRTISTPWTQVFSPISVFSPGFRALTFACVASRLGHRPL
jgi:hypothetical protein